MFENEKKDENLKLEEFLCDSIKLNIEERKLMSFMIYSSNISIYYYRKYIKISDIIPKLGGLLQMLFFILKIVYNSFDKITIDRKLTKKLFYLENTTNIKVNNSTFNSKTTSSSRVLTKSNIINYNFNTLDRRYLFRCRWLNNF